MISILNYGIGNILSIKNMLKKIGYDSYLAYSEEDLYKATKVILPGVGNFDSGMNLLRKAPFYNILCDKVINEKIPLLGICLGAQMLMDYSEEGKEKGLGWIKGYCKKFDKSIMPADFAIPNMGWLDVNYVRDSKLNISLSNRPRYYFVHSYHICCSSANNILATSEYGHTFTAAVFNENIYGVQFHPEKSHKFGLEVLRNFGGL